jgi:hypothetical protein
LAAALEYHVVLLLPAIWLEAITRPGRMWRSVILQQAAISVVVVAFPLTYMVWSHAQFGFWITPPLFQFAIIPHINIGYVVSTFVSYADYLGLLMLPLSAIPIWERVRTRRAFVQTFAAAAVLFALGSFLVGDNGEMNFGPLDPYLGPRLIGGAFALFAGLFFAVLYDGIKKLGGDEEARRRMLCLAAAILGFLAVLSFPRPAQRYLLFVLPLTYLFICQRLRQRSVLAYGTTAFYLAAIVFISINQLATGIAVDDIVRQLRDRAMIDASDACNIMADAGDRFPLRGTITPKFTVISGSGPGQILHSESRPFPLIHRSYAVVPLEHTP